MFHKQEIYIRKFESNEKMNAVSFIFKTKCKFHILLTEYVLFRIKLVVFNSIFKLKKIEWFSFKFSTKLWIFHIPIGTMIQISPQWKDFDNYPESEKNISVINVTLLRYFNENLDFLTSGLFSMTKNSRILLRWLFSPCCADLVFATIT